jgi:putative tricarboxylic transport membrane protein
MKNRDLVSSIVWISLGGVFVIAALQQGLMHKGVPGPGFLPFFSGIALILFSLFILIPALGKRVEIMSGSFFPERGSFRKLAFAVLALFAYGVALEYVGYLITTFVFIIHMARLIEPKSWLSVILMACATAVISNFLFVVLLDVQLPKGPFGL